MSNVKQNAKKTRGVTLMEILVSMVILTVGVYMVYNIFPLGFAASWRSKNRTIATQLAQQKLEEILNNKYSTDCQRQNSKTCAVRILETDYASPEDYSDATYDCRYFYGGPIVNGQVQDATFCSKDFGNIDNNIYTEWVKFLDNPEYWYYIDITPVVGGGKKFRSLGDMVRITVTVRGPIKDMTDWPLVTGGQNKRWDKLPVEIVVSTLKTNKYFAYTYINTLHDASNGYVNWHNGVFDNMGQGNLSSRILTEYDPNSSMKLNGRTVWVNNIRNFTMLFAPSLAYDERQDKGKVHLIAKGSVTADQTDRNGNKYGIDNVLIVREIVQQTGSITDSNPTTVKTYYSCQTNKIVRIKYDNTQVINPLTSPEIPGEITFYDPLFKDSTIGLEGSATVNLQTYLDNSICNVEKYGGSDIYNEVGYSLLRGSDTTSSYVQGVPGATRFTGTQYSSPPSGFKARSLPSPYYYDIPYNGSVSAKTCFFAVDPSGHGGSVSQVPDKSWDFSGLASSSYVQTGSPYTAYKFPPGYMYRVRYYVIHLSNIKVPPSP